MYYLGPPPPPPCTNSVVNHSPEDPDSVLSGASRHLSPGPSRPVTAHRCTAPSSGRRPGGRLEVLGGLGPSVYYVVGGGSWVLTCGGGGGSQVLPCGGGRVLGPTPPGGGSSTVVGPRGPTTTLPPLVMGPLGGRRYRAERRPCTVPPSLKYPLGPVYGHGLSLSP